MVAKGFKGLGLKKSLKACGLLIVSMESIAEVKIVSVKYQCSSCNVIRDEDQFVKCVGKCDTCKTCQICRDTKKKYRYKVKASKVILVDDVLSVSSSSSSPLPADYFGPVPPPPLPPGLGLIRCKAKARITYVES